MRFNTVVFDLDGTLLYSLPDIAGSVNYVLEKKGYPVRALEEICRFVGNGSRNLIRLSLPEAVSEAEREACHDLYLEHYNQNKSNTTKPYDGVMELLEELKKRQVKMAVVSNKGDQDVKGLCEELFSDYIPIAIGEREGIRRKPTPDSTWEAMRLLQADKAHTLYIGDSDVDMKTARNAGVYAVGAAWGYRGREILQKEGADMILDEPMQLLTLL